MIGANQITSSHILDGQVNTADIAGGALTQILVANASTSNPSTTVSSFVDLNEMLISGTFFGGRVLAWLMSVMNNASAGSAVQLGINVDGGTSALAVDTSATAAAINTVSVFMDCGVLTGPHTIKGQYCTYSGGTAIANGTQRRMIVVEFKR
jgi:hypothetical protein